MEGGRRRELSRRESGGKQEHGTEPEMGGEGRERHRNRESGSKGEMGRGSGNGRRERKELGAPCEGGNGDLGRAWVSWEPEGKRREPGIVGQTGTGPRTGIRAGEPGVGEDSGARSRESSCRPGDTAPELEDTVFQLQEPLSQTRGSVH